MINVTLISFKVNVKLTKIIIAFSELHFVLKGVKLENSKSHNKSLKSFASLTGTLRTKRAAPLSYALCYYVTTLKEQL